MDTERDSRADDNKLTTETELALRAEIKLLRESRDKLEVAFEYADREARLAIEAIKEKDKEIETLKGEH